MWPFLPKKCNCSATPTNPGTSCDHSGLTTNDLIYNGPDGVCSNVTTEMTVTEAFQQLDYFLCSVEFTQYLLDLIQNNPNLFPNFITLVNGAINCSTIITCGPPPIDCTFTANANQLLSCTFIASATELPTCNFTGSVNQLPSCTFTGNVNQVSDTTTTTSSSSTSTSTSTSTSSTTTTTTTLLFGQLIVENLTVNLTVNSVTSLFGFISFPPPTNPIALPGVIRPDGIHEALVNPLTVNVSSNISPDCMKLYKNNVFIEQITTTGTGIYSFAAIPILVTDVIKIVIVDFACIEPV